MNPDQHAELRNIAESRQGKRRSLLPSPAPAAGVPPQELMAWLTVALGLGSDPIANVTRFGRHDDARLVATLRSSQRIVFDRQADAFNADILVRRVILVTGAEVPAYTRADALVIAATLVRAADLACEGDDRAEARDWARTFLHEATELLPEDTATPEGRYRILRTLLEWRHPEPHPGMSIAQRAAVVRDHEGALLVRVSQFAAHVRGVAGKPVPWHTLHSRMTEVGLAVPE